MRDSAEPPKTPMCAKLKLCFNDMRVVREFLEWTASQGLEFARFHKHSKHCEHPHEHKKNVCDFYTCKQKTDRVCGFNEESLEPHIEGVQAMLMRWMEIDERKLEDERRALLDHHRLTTGQR